MNPMLESFISESRDLLEAAGTGFLELEKDPENAAILNDIFRSMHTIKGSSGLFDIKPFTSVVHAAEDALELYRNGSLVLDADVTDLFLEVMDQVGQWLDELEQGDVLAADAIERSQTLTQRIRNVISDAGLAQSEIEIGGGLATETGLSPMPEWIATLQPDQKTELLAKAKEDPATLFAIDYEPDAECFFSGDDPLFSAMQTPGLLYLHLEPRSDWPALAEMDPFRCVLRFRIVSNASREQLLETFQYVIDYVTVLEFDSHELTRVDASGCTQSQKRLLELLDAQIDCLRNPGSAEIYDGKIAAVSLIVDRVLSFINSKDGQHRLLRQARDNCLQQRNGRELVDFIKGICASLISTGRLGSREDSDNLLVNVLETQLIVLALPRPECEIEGVVTSVEAVLKSALLKTAQPSLLQQIEAIASRCGVEYAERGRQLAQLLQAHLQAVAPVVEIEDKAAGEFDELLPDEGEKRITGSEKKKNQVLRVDQARIDMLMDLVGELVVAKNALPFLARRAEEEFGNRALAKEIKSQYSVINRISEELQGAVMQVRMVPVSGVFQRFPRLVRDLSRKLEKDIRLEIIGEDTEADKNVVEDLPDPLVHLIRNSVDHGIESPEERIAKGKPRQGTIRLRAYQQDDQVVIEIEDDGKGIDPAVVKQKAYERGLLHEDKIDTISDAEALQFVLEPGFSTAAAITDLSGRGVGMDVVRTTVSRLGGHIVVSSVKGQGSLMRLTLPLSMAITQVMMIETAGESFGVPIDAVSETVRVPLDEVKRIKDREMIVLRDRLLPVCRLNQVLALHEQEQGNAELALLVVRIDGNELGLVVDRFHAGIDIILRPLEGIMSAFRHYAGTALLGDGKVLLVLNLRELVRCL